MEDIIKDQIIEDNVSKQTAYLLGEQSGIEKGIKQGIEQGIEQGIQESKKEVVINMHKNNLSTQMIANCTNLTISEVEEILKDIN